MGSGHCHEKSAVHNATGQWPQGTTPHAKKYLHHDPAIARDLPIAAKPNRNEAAKRHPPCLNPTLDTQAKLIGCGVDAPASTSQTNKKPQYIYICMVLSRLYLAQTPP